MISSNLSNDTKLEVESNTPASASVFNKFSTISSISNIPRFQLKVLMRTTSIGLNDPIRKQLWLGLALKNNNSVDGSDFDQQFDKLTTNKLPTFVDPTNARFFALNHKARRQAATVLWNLSQTFPQMTFAPLLYPLVSLFLHFHTPEDTYRSIIALLTSRESRFIGINRIDKSRDAFILIKLTNKFGFMPQRNKLASTAREKLKSNSLDIAFFDWIQWIFGCLPFHYCVRIVDCYLIEGEKFLYRVALALAQLYEKCQKQPIILEKMRSFCENIANIATPSQLISYSIKISRLSRKDIFKARNKAEKRSDSISVYAESPLITRHDVISLKEVTFGTRIAPRKFKSSILNWSQLDILWEWIPDRIYVLEPIVVFYSGENGNSLQTFYSLTGDNEPTILIVKTLKNEIFGAYCSSAWSSRLDGSNKAGQYFGNGETFLFSIFPKTIKYEWIGRHRDASQLSHSQQLFISATNRGFSIGSGGHIGIYVDENLSRGETNRSDTFENEPLIGGGETCFNVSEIEVIAFCS